MSRKPTRGYFVRGHFVAEGSEQDLELKRQAKWDAEHSKTDLKRQSEELQKLGEDLLNLRAGLFEGLDLPESLRDALKEAARIRDFEGRRRQMQYVGKLMRKLDETQVEAIRTALDHQHSGHAADVLQLHQAEAWRDKLLAEEGHEQALTDFLQQHPNVEVQPLRALIRQARKDKQALPKALPGEGQRQSRAYRELFQLLRQSLQEQTDDGSTPDV